MERLKICKIAGIYQLKSKATGELLYVGKANNLLKRKTTHIKGLENKTHQNYGLREHVKIYGVQDVLFSVVEECDVRYLDKREKYFIKILNPKYNVDGVLQRPPRSSASRTNMSKISLKRYENKDYLEEFSKLMQTRSSAPNGRIFDTMQDRLNYHYKKEMLKRVLKKLEEYKLKKKELDKWFLSNTPESLKIKNPNTSQKGFFD